MGTGNSEQSHWRTVLLQRGLDRCRAGDWENGVQDLMTVSQGGRQKDLPSELYSYLGYALARTEGNHSKGIKFCKYAIKKEFFQPDNYYNLARTLVLANKPGEAYRAVEKGLGFDPNHEGLSELWAELGQRRPPVLPFLSRGNLFNRILGRMRHDMSRTPKIQPPEGAAATRSQGS